MERREFLVQSAGVLGAGMAAGFPGTTPSSMMAAQSAMTGAAGGAKRVLLGGPLPGDVDDPAEWVRQHHVLGYRAAYCPDVDLKDTARVRAFESEARRGGLAIAEVGRWVNLLDPDAAKRRQNLATVSEGLALADALGARCCVDIAGSFNPDVWFGPHPDNLSPRFFDAAVENARAIIDAVKPTRTVFCYEMMGWSIPDSPSTFLRLLKAVDRPAFAVHLDPCNLVNSPERFYRSSALLDECFDTLGRWIVSCHAKDLAWEVEMNIHFREVRPGAGTLDYAKYLRRLEALPQQPPLMLEHMPNAAEYDAGRRHLFDLGRRIGIDVGEEVR